MAIPLCPLRLIAVAVDIDGRLTNDAVGIDCPESSECPWWSRALKRCAILVTAEAANSIDRVMQAMPPE